MTVGEKIRNLRRFRGWSQDSLAKMIHVNQSTVGKWERDPYFLPYGKMIEICKALKVTPTELMRGVDFE